MDNIQPPAGNQPPQGGSSDPNNPMGQPGTQDTGGQSQGTPGFDSGDSGSMQMPPPDGSSDQSTPGQMPGGPEQGQVAGPEQGQVEDVLEGTEGGNAQDAGGAASPNFDNQSGGGQPQEPYSGGQPAMGSDPMSPMEPPQGQDGMGDQMTDPGMAGGEAMTPQSQPDFSGGDPGMGPDQGGMPGGPAMPPGQGPNVDPSQKSGSKWLLIVLVIVVVLALGGLVFAYLKDYISLPFLDKLLGREQASEQITAPEENANNQENAFPEDQQRKDDLAQIKAGLEKYFEANQKYPIAKKLENISASTSVSYKALVPTYISTMPTDPGSPKKFYGYQSADGTSFELSAILDNEDDAEGIKRNSMTLYLLTNLSSTENSGTSDGTQDQTTDQ